MRAVATLISGGNYQAARKGRFHTKIRNRVPESPNASDEPGDLFHEFVDPFHESVDFVDGLVARADGPRNRATVSPAAPL